MGSNNFFNFSEQSLVDAYKNNLNSQVEEPDETQKNSIDKNINLTDISQSSVSVSLDFNHDFKHSISIPKDNKNYSKNDKMQKNK